MRFLNKFFPRQDKPVKSNKDFWNWFSKNQKQFYKVVKEHGDFEKDFFDKLSPRLNDIREGFYYLAGMYDDKTAELIITADGAVKNIAFVEDLIDDAPQIDGWIFTKLKPPLAIENVNISMAGYDFSSKTLGFYANELSGMPDEIDITVVHEDATAENKEVISNGVFIFLDNFLGELNLAVTIDTVTVVGKADAKRKIIPIDKLKSYLDWRQKEFIEKYDGIRRNTDDDEYLSLDGKLENGNPVIAIINKDVLEWDSKASHPWVLIIKMPYKSENKAGMPDNATYKLLEKIEAEISNEISEDEGYINIGRETYDNSRTVYFTCKDFRKPSKVLNNIVLNYSNSLKIEFDIYKDKYWQTFNRFRIGY